MSQAHWATTPIKADNDSSGLFFTPHEWETVDSASARIIPTDRHPGAHEAQVVRFIDRMLSGTAYIYAAADGEGFLKMQGREEEAWNQRISARQSLYRAGIVELDQISNELFSNDFVGLAPDEQDEVLESLSGSPKPAPFFLNAKDAEGDGGAPAGNQPMNEDFLDFFPLLVLNTRQGYYADPAYGGNANHIGWRVIGFDGPDSLKSTVDGSYNNLEYMIPEARWPYERHPAVLRRGRRG